MLTKGLPKTPPDLFARGLSQRVIDPILPAGPALLKVLEHVLIDAQRNQLLHIRNRRLFGRRLRHFGGGPLERSFRFGTRVVQGSRPSRLVRHRFKFLRTTPSTDSAPRTTARSREWFCRRSPDACRPEGPPRSQPPRKCRRECPRCAPSPARSRSRWRC